MSTENNKDLDIVALVGEKRRLLLEHIAPVIDRYILCQIKLQQMRKRQTVDTNAYVAVIAEMNEAEDALKWTAENFNYETESLISPPKKPIFTTEDGVDIYEETVTLHGINTETWIPGRLHFSRIFQDPEWKWFAIPYNRDRYILLNKPTLSVNEVLDIFRDHEVFDELVSELHERAKAKL
jgi:hypothetical protein